MVKRIITTWAINLANTGVYLTSGGTRVLHEGRFRRKRWVDWYRAHACRPQQFATPETEEELCRLVAQARKVRVVGAGHSFNSATLCDELLVSLDNLAAVEVRDDAHRPGWKIADVQAGVRLRDLNRILKAHGASLPVAGSTNFQSIGGLIATDLHGTGRDHGFLSEVLVSLRIVDAAGQVQTVHPGDELFHAAIGAAGTCGVVVGAEIRCDPAFNLAKEVKVMPRDWVEEHLDELLQENDHLSFYVFGGLSRSLAQDEKVGQVRMNKWNRTVDPPTPLRRVHKMTDEVFDMVFSGHLLGVARVLHKADALARVGFFFYRLFVNHRTVVYPSGEGFARMLFYRHDEIEYGIPQEHLDACLDDIRRLLCEEHFPTIIELRFTPDLSEAMLGPGVGRATAHVELAPSMSRDPERVFRRFERIVLDHGGQPHLGKKLYLDRTDLDGIYGAEKMARFEAVRAAQDPGGKFMNAFTEQLLGTGAEAEPAVAVPAEAPGT